jgi:GNAT superfamily N-acetyltransferase
MEIKTLENTPLAEITVCFNLAFSDYFVPITATETALQKRWHGARVDYSLSFGAFEGDRLVGFIITGVDELNGKKTAYNAGTGVIPEFRGYKLVSALYSTALPVFKAAGISQCTLEVITENFKAIKAYQKVGFKIARTLHCFKGELRTEEPVPAEPEHQITTSRELAFAALQPLQPYDFSWDNRNEGLIKLAPDLELWQLFREEERQAYCILNPATGYLAQFGFAGNSSLEAGKTLFAAIGKTIPALRINNVDSTATEAVTLLKPPTWKITSINTKCCCS